MLARHYRLARHAVAAVLLAGVAVVATGIGAGAAVTTSAAADRPESYGGNAVGASMQFQVDKQPFPFPVTDPFHSWVPYAGTTLDSSGGADAVASSIYPGKGFIGVPNLICVFAAALCEQMPGGAPPDYPDWAHAQYPAHPDESAQLSQEPFPGTGPFEISPNIVKAHATPDLVEATTVTGAAGLAGVVTVQSSSSHSLQKFVGGTLMLTAESVLKGVDIGGQLHIDEIRSTATASIDGSKIGTSTAQTTVTGATVAGQGVTIDSTGVHAAGNGDGGVLKQTVNSALENLASAGITIRSLGTTKSARPSKVTAETGGLLLQKTQEIEAPGLPGLGDTENGVYTVTVSIGGAGINAFASPAVPSLGGGTVTLPPPAKTPGSVPGVPNASGSVVPPPAAPQVGTQPPADQPAQVAGAPTKPVALPIDLTNKKLKTLALVLLGYPLLVLIGAPLRAPARLPRLG